MAAGRRSRCPISFTLDLVGDRWSLLILRDLVFGGPRHYRALAESGEGIATNILADRLRRLESARMIRKRRDPEDRKRWIYSLTSKGLDAVPILLEMIVWGATYDPHTAAPPALVERCKHDRDRLIAEIRARARDT